MDSQTELGKENNNVETTSFMEDTNENKNSETTSTQFNENMEKIMEWFLNSANSTGMGEIEIINQPEIIYSALSSRTYPSFVGVLSASVTNQCLKEQKQAE